MSKLALITGGSRGIGAATAIKLAEQGYDIALNYLQDHQSAQGIQQQIIELGQAALLLPCDVSDEASVVTMFKAIDTEFGRLDALVNNAGILFKQTTVDQLTAERINRVLATNVLGPFLCCREAVLRMSTDRGGSGGAIVNVSSAAARLGAAGEYVDYAASKGAIDTLTIGLANEVAGQGIRVNAVRPGYIYTQMHADGGEPNRVDRLKQNLPIKRGGQPAEVAAAIVWLLSDESSYTTGGFIEVSGGR